MASYSNYQSIVETRIKKGDSEEDNLSKFICYWVAFNCVLFTETGVTSDRAALEKLYEKNAFVSVFDKLAGKNKSLIEQLAAIGPVKNNRRERERVIKDPRSLREVMDLLYEIRCNLFHGSKADTNQRDTEVITAATPVLELIAKHFFIQSAHLGGLIPNSKNG